MKILFINISDIKGGAAISMYRIGKVLETKYKTTNLFIVRSKFSNDKNVIQVGSIFLRILNILFNLIGLQYKFLPTKLMREARKFKPDVISLNQIEGGYFQTRDIIKLSKIAPIYWTMHDLWALNNNAHKEPDLRGTYPQVGIRWGNWLKNQKFKTYKKADFRIISPSRWMFKKMTAIPKSNRVIYHGVDLEKFKPVSIYRSRAGEIKSILFVAEKVSKGDFGFLKYLDEMLDFKIQLITIGEGELKGEYKHIIIKNRGYLNEEELIYYYNLADVYVHPTRADNCPLTVLEAMACGTPVVAYDVGGVGELTDYTTNNEMLFAMMVNGLLKTTIKSLTKKFDINKTAKEYYEIFSEASRKA